MDKHETSEAKGALPPPELSELVRRLVEERGEERMALRLGISRPTLARLGAGFRCQRSTIAAAAAMLGLKTTEE